MAVLYVTEFSTYQTLNIIPAVAQPPVTEQTVAISGSSTLSSAFNANTGLVRLQPDSVCSVKFGSSPTASSTTMRMAAGQTEYFVVAPGQKVAVITNT